MYMLPDQVGSEMIIPTCSVLKHFNRSVVDLCNSLHLNVVAIAIVKPLTVDVMFKVLIRDILREVVCVFKLKEGREGRERERRVRKLTICTSNLSHRIIKTVDLYPIMTTKIKSTYSVHVQCITCICDLL